MTHGVFYLRDANDFLITSESLPPQAGENATGAVGVDMLEDGFAYRPGLISLINLARSAEASAQQSGQDITALGAAINAAQAVVQTPVEEESYALALRALRKEIRSLDVPQATLPVMKEFATPRW